MVGSRQVGRQVCEERNWLIENACVVASQWANESGSVLSSFLMGF